MDDYNIEHSSSPTLPHTLEDPDAEQYIQNSFNDREPLISPPIHSTRPGSVNIQRHNNHGAYNYENPQYYIQHSTSLDINSYRRRSDHCSCSPVRRMFLLLALFDGLLMFLMWVIYVQISGGMVFDRIKKEIEDFQFNKSFFDLCATSFVRSMFLLLAYGCCKSMRWYAVAFSTTISSVYLLVKVFMTSFKIGQPMNYILVIFSMVICWCEAWHFDFQVIPQELNEDKIAASVANSTIEGGSNVLPPEIAPRSTKSMSAFFTPYAGSIYRARTPSEGSSNLSNLSGEINSAIENDQEYIQIANETVQLVFRMLFVTDNWNLERVEHNIVVQSRDFQGVGKVFKLEALFDIPKHILEKLFWDNVDSQPVWNRSVKESQVVHRINSKTEILYTVSAEAAAGVIAPRDFVCIRRRKKKDLMTLICVKSIETDLVPVNRSIIRGTNGPGGWVLREVPNEPNTTEFIWLLNTTLKGWLPQKLVEQAIVGVMVNTCNDIAQHASSLVAS